MERNENYLQQFGDLINAILNFDKAFNLQQGSDQNYLFYGKHGLGFPNNDPNKGDQNPIEYYKKEERLIELINDIVLPTMYLQEKYYRILKIAIMHIARESDPPLAQLLEKKI